MELNKTSSGAAREAFYASSVPPGVGELLEEAMSVYHDTQRAEALLLKALENAPEALAVYFSLYKFYFYKGRLADAEIIVRKALSTAASQASFPDVYRELSAATVDWSQHDSPQHFYLFTLKALAFIRLRRGDPESCEQILGKLRELDQADTVGSSVISALAAGL